MSVVPAKSILIFFCFPVVFAVDVISVEKAPYVVIVLCNNSKYFCTGVILHEAWVLTSAHCLYDIDGTYTENHKSVFVVSGTNQLNEASKDIERGVAQIRQSEELIVYDSYTFAENFIDDLVLIRLQEPFNMTSRTKKAPVIPDRYEQADIGDIPRRMLTLYHCTGFGYGNVNLHRKSIYNNSLKKQTYQVGKYCYCLKKVWSTRSQSNVLKENMFICEDNKTTGELCSGDQGSPLICENFLRGIGTASFHYTDIRECRVKKDGPNECGYQQTMYVFTDLCYRLFSQWLKHHVPGYPLLDERCEQDEEEQYYQIDTY